MKHVTLEEAEKRLSQLLAEAENEAIVILKEGKPVGLLSAWPDLDQESLDRASSSSFWRMIQARRSEKGIPWEDAKIQLGLGPG